MNLGILARHMASGPGLHQLRAFGAKVTALVEGDTVVLSGTALVKVTEPGRPEPVAVITGDSVTFSLLENRIRVVGQSGKPAELTFTPKEDQPQ